VLSRAGGLTHDVLLPWEWAAILLR
jgi:hypothetical protein